MAVDSYSNNGAAVNFYELPEGCISNAISLTSPRDACRLSLVASTFRSAAQSDAVWERFLPSDYREIIARCVDGPDSLRFASKKELYLHLCDHPILIDGGTKMFFLEKWSGKKCYMIAARDLNIVWSDTPRYWKWMSLPESRFPKVVELLDVCWLEIRGKIKTSMLSPDTTYEVYFVFTTKSNLYGFDHQPAEGKVGINGQEYAARSVYLDPEGAQRHRYQIVPRRIGLFNHHLANVTRQQIITPADQNAQYPKRRPDNWMEVQLGECFVRGRVDGDLEMSLWEINGGNWKSGIVIQGIEIRPKSV